MALRKSAQHFYPSYYTTFYLECQEEFLYIINMNTAGVKLTLEDIENIPIQQVKEEVEGYLKYVTDHLKNSLSPQTIQMRNKKNI